MNNYFIVGHVNCSQAHDCVFSSVHNHFDDITLHMHYNDQVTIILFQGSGSDIGEEVARGAVAPQLYCWGGRHSPPPQKKVQAAKLVYGI